MLGQLTRQDPGKPALSSVASQMPTPASLLTNDVEKFAMSGNSKLPSNLKTDTFSLYLCVNINRLSVAILVNGDLPTLSFLWLMCREVKREANDCLKPCLSRHKTSRMCVCTHSEQ